MHSRDLHSLARSLGFPSGAWATDDTGLRATWDSEALATLGWVTDGVLDGGVWLALNRRRRWGQLTWRRGSGENPFTEVYENGHWESFDSWSDGRRPERMGYAAWCRRSVGLVLGRVGCTLCGTRLNERKVARHTANRMGCICAPCLKRVGNEDPTPRQWPLGRRICSACQRNHADDELLFQGRAGHLCPDCVDALVPLDLRSRLGL